jgi:predicted aspartyl protease
VTDHHINEQETTMARLFFLAAVSSTLSLCLVACQSAAQQSAASQPAQAQTNIVVDSSPPGEADKRVLSGPPSVEIPLQWQTHDSFVVVDGTPQPIHGHKTKRVIIPVTLTNTDGTQATMQFLLDTGADRTVINTSKVHADLKNASVEQCAGVGGMQQVSVVTVPRLAVGALAQENCQVAFTSMPVDEDGLLGQDFLRHYSVTIDYRHATLRLDRSEAKEQK